MTEPLHLSKIEETISSGAEWQLKTNDWVVLQLCEGIAYTIDPRANKEIAFGSVIVCPPNSGLTLTASVLGRALFRGMAIRVSSLTGFLTALERQCLETAVARQCEPCLSLPPEHPLAVRVKEIFAADGPLHLAGRLAFAHAFAELIAPQLQEALQKATASAKSQHDAKGRLRIFIGQIPESELSNMSLGKMAKMLHCCERHASRLFREEWGTGFVTYISELRLKRACDLLQEGNRKIIDVALESGHGSLAHFNYVFKKRFRMTPTQWRQRQISPLRPAVRRRVSSRILQFTSLVAFLLFTVVAATTSRAGAGTGPVGATNSVTNAPAASRVQKFRVDHYRVIGNTLLATNIITRVLAPFTGPAIDTNTVAQAQGALQLEYYQRGFATVKVVIPRQDLTNYTVTFQAIEGRLSDFKILHNRYFSSNNIMALLPYVKRLKATNGILNAKVFEEEMTRANSNPDRQISSKLLPGVEPGTTALVLDVKDRVPLHGRIEMDNYSPPGTPELRVNGNLSYGNLWQLDHTLGLQYGFSPEMMKPSLGSDTHIPLNILDSPDVTYYSAFYRAPLGAPTAVDDQIARDQTHFGYNEITKQFVLPTAMDRPEFSAYASRSTTSPTLNGPVNTVTNTALLDIQKQVITQQDTTQTTVGARLSFPLPTWQNIHSTWSVGIDYKDDKVVTLPTNYLYYTSISTHGNNSQAPPTITHTTIGIGSPGSFPYVQYTPLTLSWNGSRQDHWGQKGAPADLSSEMDASFSIVAGTGGTISKQQAFPVLISANPEATTEFVAVRPQISRTQVLPDNFTLFGNLAGQWANVPLLNLEQFELGGNSSVRGYREGEVYSDTGWVGQMEVRSPIFWRGASALKIGTQITTFMDYGQGYQLDIGNHESLWGGGLGLNFNFGHNVESHILIAWPLLDSPDSKAGHERISFSLSAQL